MKELWDALSWKNYGMHYREGIMGCVTIKELWVVLSVKNYGMYGCIWNVFLLSVDLKCDHGVF